MTTRFLGNAKEMVLNALVSRQVWLQKLLDPRRDIDKEAGHPQTISREDYAELYRRGDIAARVVSLFPEECWSQEPEVFETEDSNETVFEKAWKQLQKDFNLYPLLQRADVLSGVGRFGVLLLGLDDGEDLQKPIEGINEKGVAPQTPTTRKLIYLRPFDESLVLVNKLENDVKNPRYGLPLEYQIHFVDTTIGDAALQKSNSTARNIHWTRIIHLADNRTNSEVFGLPRMEKVFNRLLDLKKIMGGSGEMFWKGGFPGYSLEAVPTPAGEDPPELDKEATKEQMEAYMNGLQRYIATIGLNVKSLSVQIADPSKHVETQLKIIAAALGVPWRVLIGSEAAQLASEQDSRSWNKRIARRRQEYVTPFVIRPFVDRLIAVGVLPPPKDEYFVEWPDLNTPSEDERAGVAEKQTNALSKYVQGGVDMLMPPFHWLTLVLGLSDEEAQSVIDAAEERIAEIDPEGTPQPGQARPAPQPAEPTGEDDQEDDGDESEE